MKNLIIILSLVLSSCSIYKNAFVQEDLGKEKIVIKTDRAYCKQEKNYKSGKFSNKIHIYSESYGYLYIKTNLPEFDDMDCDEEISELIIRVDSVFNGYNYGSSYNNNMGSVFNFGKYKSYFGHDTISNKLYSVTYFRFEPTDRVYTDIVELENRIKYEFWSKYKR